MAPRKTRNSSSGALDTSGSRGSSSKRRATAMGRANAQKPVKLGARQGGLQFVTKFPLDVLYEIFRLLHPRDLLALSRTDKSIRAVLLNHAASGVWKEAIASTGIPELPDDVSPPRYASLAFDLHCEMCDRHKAGIYHWSLRTRLCRKCSKTHLAPVETLISAGGSLGIDHLFKETIPTSEHSDYILQTLPAAFRALRDDWRKIASADMNAYLEERKKHCASVMLHGRRCALWQNELSLDRSVARGHLREERTTAIVGRLRKMGYDEELDFGMDDVARHPAVAQPRALTDRIWQNSEPALLKLMQDIRRDMERSQRKLDVRSFLRGGCLLREDVKAVLPDLGDLDAFPDVSALLDISIDMDSNEYARRKQKALDSFPEALAKWRRQLGVALYDNMHKSMGAPRPFPTVKSDEDKLAVLGLATTIFTCLFGDASDDTACSYEHYTIKAYAYPYVLAHACNAGRDINEKRVVYLPWMPYGLQYDRSLSKVVASLVRLCGLDPSTATREDMDACDARFTCKLCLLDCASFGHVEAYDTPLAETWWSSVHHWYKYHAEDGEDADWLRLSPVAEEIIRAVAPPLTDDDRRAWRCMRCTENKPRKAVIFPSWTDAKSHAITKHGVRHGNNVRGRDFIAQDAYASVLEPDAVDLCDVLCTFVDRKLALDGTVDFFVRTPESTVYFVKLLKIALRHFTGGDDEFEARVALELLED